jgi:hypothetical protein
LNQIPTDTLVDVLDDWMRRWQRCFNIRATILDLNPIRLIAAIEHTDSNRGKNIKNSRKIDLTCLSEFSCP